MTDDAEAARWKRSEVQPCVEPHASTFAICSKSAARILVVVAAVAGYRPVNPRLAATVVLARTSEAKRDQDQAFEIPQPSP